MKGALDPMPGPIDAHVGARIRARRRECGWSQASLAAVLGIGERQMREIERGRLRAGPARLVAIAVFLDMPISYFFAEFEPLGRRDGEEQVIGKSIGLACCLTAALGSSAQAEMKEVVFARVRSFSALPLMVMEDQKLVEKHARQAGLGEVSVSYRAPGAGNAVNDALISGSAQFAAAGVTAFLTLWDKSRDNLGVHMLRALDTIPAYLSSRNPKIRSLADFGDNDRINVTAPKTATQAIFLQMAAAQAFGSRNFAKLDRLTIGLTPPDGAIALLSGKGEVTADFALPPFSYEELASPNVHLLLNSQQLLGGPATASVLYTTNAVYTENPKTVAAVLAALDEALEFIAHDRTEASKAFVHVGGGKDTPLLRKMVADKNVNYDKNPHRVEKIVQFMCHTGSLKNCPQTWRDLFFPQEAAVLHGD